MRSIHFTEEHDAFRREVRRFVTREVTPHADAWEAAGRIPREIFVRMGELVVGLERTFQFFQQVLVDWMQQTWCDLQLRGLSGAWNMMLGAACVR